MVNITRKHVCEACGWIGMAFVQGATLPTTLGFIIWGTGTLPPVSMVLLVWFGLAFYFVRAYAQRDKLYMLSNGFGFFVNTILLALIALPYY